MPPRRDATDRATSRVVGSNVSRIRKAAAMTGVELARRMTELGVPLSHSGVYDIERGQRAVSVDQLTALSVSLSVSPLALLMPPTETGNDVVALTGVPAAKGFLLLPWLQGFGPFNAAPDDDGFEAEAFRRRTLPKWMWRPWKGGE